MDFGPLLFTWYPDGGPRGRFDAQLLTVPAFEMGRQFANGSKLNPQLSLKLLTPVFEGELQSETWAGQACANVITLDPAKYRRRRGQSLGPSNDLQLHEFMHTLQYADWRWAGQAIDDVSGSLSGRKITDRLDRAGLGWVDVTYDLGLAVRELTKMGYRGANGLDPYGDHDRLFQERGPEFFEDVYLRRNG